MAHYYEENDLNRFGEVGRERPDLYAKFMEWYGATLAEGELTRREKALIGLAVSHALQCAYCIDSFTQQCLESGANAGQMTEAVHVAAGVRGGSALVHGIQMINSLDKVSM
jgi:alkylhydroperoxidase/carboxymuconolactone decarboxylase family protein